MVEDKSHRIVLILKIKKNLQKDVENYRQMPLSKTQKS